MKEIVMAVWYEKHNRELKRWILEKNPYFYMYYVAKKMK